MSKERLRNEDARSGDVLVSDSITSGKPDLPIDQDPGHDTEIGINADELGPKRGNDRQPKRGRDGAL
ncbi:MAG TPA: hypothetical protein VL173_01975 [Vicinamibacterales bacterium]|jgi:hypothetical protein|nr:hypothetical protein [Vicinamibacterales bacterium]